eukprot:6177082-Pleurochrysis_carterae.AAC.1
MYSVLIWPKHQVEANGRLLRWWCDCAHRTAAPVALLHWLIDLEMLSWVVQRVGAHRYIHSLATEAL